jgi:DNA modification methylase
MTAVMNSVYWGDCLEVLNELESETIDMILVDPPFGSTRSQWDKVIPIADFWKAHNRVIKPNGAVVVLAAQPFASHLLIGNSRYFKYELIWRKNKATGHLNAKKMPLRIHENILVFYKKPPVYHPQKTEGHKPANAYTTKPRQNRVYGNQKDVLKGGGHTDRYPTSVLDFDRLRNDSPDRIHVNQKPTDLCRYLIRTFTDPEDVVLDSCLGSGTTALAAMLENRYFIGIEKDPVIYKQAVERLARQSGREIA